ncbi:MAG: hypothetical protein JWN70_6695 [Planctomycetaceae bacterium]|nr:hypothetical protein [Planctomycetaceae bacterium]
MDLDLRKDFKSLSKHVQDRVRDWPVYVNSGPGADEDPIALITFGFQMDQSGWAALVFDTRRKAAFDGTWQSWIEPNAVELRQWEQAFRGAHQKPGKVSITLQDGSQASLDAEDPTADLANCFGNLLRDVLIAARDAGVLKGLPVTKDCQIGVEDHDGQFGWIGYFDGRIVEEDENDPKVIMRRVLEKVGKLSPDKQIDYWFEQLEQLAAGKPCDVSKLIRVEEFVLDNLGKFGKAVVLRMLEYVSRWASKSEWKGEGKNIKEMPHQGVVLSVLWKAEKIGIKKNAAAEDMLCEIVRKSAKANARRTLWGAFPWHAARALHNQFKGYPEAKTNSRTNKLVNAEKFMTPGGTDS